MNTISGPTGFGNTKAFVVRGLQPKTLYDFIVKHECVSNPGTYSYNKTMSDVSTLDPGNCYQLNMSIL